MRNSVISLVADGPEKGLSMSSMMYFVEFNYDVWLPVEKLSRGGLREGSSGAYRSVTLIAWMAGYSSSG